MSKFNLKNYKKIDGDEHIDSRLQESHEDAPDQISEAQLEEYRSSSEPDVLLEKLLENKRLGAETEITEKRLDDHKSKFANKYRNPDAYKGDINKLEEKRLKNDPVEKEEYKSASECPKEMRWWEGVKSPDGLKLAKNDKVIKTAQVDEMDPVEMDMEEDIPDFNVMEDKLAEQIAEEANMQMKQEEEEDSNRGMSESDVDRVDVLKWKELPNDKDPDLNGLYVVLGYDAIAFGGDEERIKQAALHKMLEVNDKLDGKIFVEDFYDIKDEGDEGTVKFRGIGPSFSKESLHSATPSASVDTPSTTVEDGDYSEVGYREQDVDGTPMATGTVILTRDLSPNDLDEKNIEVIKREIVNFVKSKHPHLQISEDSLDMIDLQSKGEVGYAVGIMPSDDFPIVEASSKKK